MRVVAIDPGPEQSAFIVWDGRVIEFDHVPNQTLRSRLKENNFGGAAFCAIEGVACYGMAVGKEVFDTCIWIGRFWESTPLPSTLVYRKAIKIFLCNSARAKDKNVRQALIGKYGIPGTKNNPGVLYGVSGHAWSALAVADYALSFAQETDGGIAWTLPNN